MLLGFAVLTGISANQGKVQTPTRQVRFSVDEWNWVATKDDKVLWKEPRGYVRKAESKNHTALSAFDEILIVDQPGKIVGRLPTTCKYDPKVMVFCGDIFVYTTENWGWRYEKKGTGQSRVSNMKWISESKPLRIYDPASKKLLYHGPLYSLGLPVQGESGYLTTLYHRNRTRWMALTDDVPIFELRRIRLKDMKVVQTRRLHGNSKRLNELAGHYWSNEEGPYVKFKWSNDQSVSILDHRFSLSLK